MKNEEEKKFKLWPAISVPDKNVRSIVGESAWQSMKSNAFRRDNYTCQGCTFEPYEAEPDEVLDIHVVEVNNENPANSEVRTTCKLCHFIEHVDASLAKGYVELVNSYFSQGQLVNICRNNSLSDHIENGDIRYIKKTPQEYIEELKNGIAKEGRVKVIFTEKFMREMGISND